MKFIVCMQMNMKVSYKLILIFWVCLARPSQSTYDFSHLAWRHAAKNSHFELGKKCLFPSQTLIRELIISRKLL